MRFKLIISLYAFACSLTMNASSIVADSGAWCWFADPRAIHHENKALGINKTYVGCIDNLGNIKAVEYDFNKGTQQTVLIRSCFQPDDHDNPTFIAIPDGRVIVFYSRHTDEPGFYYRVTDNSGDLSTLGAEKYLKTENNTTYPSPFLMSDDPEHIYLCWRGINWHPTIARLTMPDKAGELGFDISPKQIVQSSGARPYAKYNSNGKDKIYLTYTTGHPDNELPNHLYYNVLDINTGNLYDIAGTKLNNVWTDHTFKLDKSEAFVNSHKDMVVDCPAELRDWVWQLALDKKGNPVIAMVTISPDKKEHKYYIARHDVKEWSKRFITDGGGWFHQSPDIEHCYSGGMAIDPDNADIVYCSVPVEGKYGNVYEIVKYTLGADGNIEKTDTITRNSAKNNVRPYIIPQSGDTPLRLAWMYGNYYDWIVSQQRPLGYDTCIVADFSGMTEANTSYPENNNWKVSKKCEYAKTIDLTPYDLKNGDFTLDLGDVKYVVDKETFYPEIRYKGKVWKGNNRVATSQGWQNNWRATNGKWYTPVPYDNVKIRLTCKNGTVKTYINGMLDQTVNLN